MLAILVHFRIASKVILRLLRSVFIYFVLLLKHLQRFLCTFDIAIYRFLCTVRIASEIQFVDFSEWYL